MKKLMIVALAAVFVLALAAPAMAAGHYDNYGEAVADYNQTHEPGDRGDAVSAAADNDGGFATTLLPFFEDYGFGPYR